MADLLRTLLCPRHGAYVLDKDGTLLNQTRPIDGAADFLRHLLSRGIPHVILTNTGEKTGAQVAASIGQVLGLAPGAVDARRVVTARDVALRRAEEATRFRRILVLGQPADGHDAFDRIAADRQLPLARRDRRGRVHVADEEAVNRGPVGTERHRLRLQTSLVDPKTPQAVL